MVQKIEMVPKNKTPRLKIEIVATNKNNTVIDLRSRIEGFVIVSVVSYIVKRTHRTTVKKMNRIIILKTG